MADPVVTGAMAPVNGTAARVVAKAKEENQWRPMPKPSSRRTSDVPIPIAALPHTAPKELLTIVGRRRDRLVIIGYAQEQGSKKGSAKWVVRCDCGNYEKRTSILRWLGTQAPDMCTECQNRRYILAQGKIPGSHPAARRVVEIGGDHG